MQKFQKEYNISTYLSLPHILSINTLIKNSQDFIVTDTDIDIEYNIDNRILIKDKIIAIYRHYGWNNMVFLFPFHYKLLNSNYNYMIAKLCINSLVNKELIRYAGNKTAFIFLNPANNTMLKINISKVKKNNIKFNKLLQSTAKLMSSHLVLPHICSNSTCQHKGNCDLYQNNY